MDKKKTSASDNLTPHQRVLKQLSHLPKKPSDSETQEKKKGYSEKVSQIIAVALADELRQIGLHQTRPTEPGLTDQSGAERRMAGGLGAKKVDVTWATAEGGLMFGVSIKSINFRDKKSGNFQKNLTNRRGDMLFECVTLHRRFPYAVLFGVFLLDGEADKDGTDKRDSTFTNAHEHFGLFTGRDDPADRDEQFERMYIALLHMDDGKSKSLDFFEVGKADEPMKVDAVLKNAAAIIAKRNPDFYRFEDGKLKSRSGRRQKNG